MTQPMFNNNEKKEEVCGWCSVGNRECDCDKCGVTGCFECVSGYHGLNETLNLCPECEEESDEEETLVMPDEMSKYIHDFIRAPKRFPAAHHDAFVEGIASLKSFIAETNQEDYNGREALQYHLWAMLEDTPYSRGEEMFAGWNSMEDTKKAREVASH